MQRQEIKDKRVREKLRRRGVEERERKMGKGYEKKLSAGENNRGC